jgi:hypothetical protein
VHGLVSLELQGNLPPTDEMDPIYERSVRVFVDGWRRVPGEIVPAEIVPTEIVTAETVTAETIGAGTRTARDETRPGEVAAT